MGDVAQLQGGERLGKYELIGVIGEGGMSRVYRAVLAGPLGFRKEIALKRIRDELVVSSPLLRTALINEARLGGYLRHPNLVETYEFLEIDGSFLIALELVDGLPLNTMLDGCRARGTRIPLSAALDAIHQICAGMSYAHSVRDESDQPLNIVHRDMKPANVIVTRSGIAKVTDFGIAMAAGRLGAKTVTGMTKGTPYYMSPEQIEGDRTLDGRADIFSIGAILYELCTGDRLFRGSDLTSVFFRIMTGKRDPYIARLEELLEGLGEVVENCIEPKREDRYEDVEALRAALGTLRERHEAGGLALRECVVGLIASANPETRADPTRKPEFASLIEAGSELPEDTGWPGFVRALQATPEEPDPIREARARALPSTNSRSGTAPTSRLDRSGSRTSPTGTEVMEFPPPGRGGARRTRAALVGLIGLGALASAWALSLPDGDERPRGEAPPPIATAPEEPAPPALVEAAPPSEAAPELRDPPPKPQEPPEVPAESEPDATPAEQEPEPPAVAEEPPPAGADAPPVSFVINTLPWANLTRGGQALGNTPYEAELPAGTHRYTATSPITGATHEFTLQLSAGDDGPIRYCWDFRTGAECKR